MKCRRSNTSPSGESTRSSADYLMAPLILFAVRAGEGELAAARGTQELYWCKGAEHPSQS